MKENTLDNARRIPNLGIVMTEKEGLRLDEAAMAAERLRIEKLRIQILQSPLVAAVSLILWEEIDKSGVKPT